MANESQFDFLVIGAGIAGASAAYELIQHGSVLILEAEDHPGYHTTGRSASVFLEVHGNATLRALMRRSRPFFESPPEGFADAPLLGDRGALFIARSDQIESFEEFVRRSYSDRADIITGNESLALDKHPALRPGYVAASLWDADAMEIDVHALLQGFLRLFRRAGGLLRTGERVSALRRQGAYWKVETGEGEYRASVLVNAAGAWADEVGQMAGAQTIGLIPKRRSVCIIDPGPFDVTDWPMVGDVDEEFYFKADAGKVLLSPADETPMPPCDVYPDDLDIARAVERLEAATTIKVTRKIDRQWAGLRSFVSDGLPVVGFDMKAPRFFWLAGQGGDGIQTAPAMGRLAAALATDKPVPDDLAAEGLSRATLSPERLDHTSNG